MPNALDLMKIILEIAACGLILGYRMLHLEIKYLGQSQWECHRRSYQDWKLENCASRVSW